MNEILINMKYEKYEFYFSFSDFIYKEKGYIDIYKTITNKNDKITQ